MDFLFQDQPDGEPHSPRIRYRLKIFRRNSQKPLVRLLSHCIPIPETDTVYNSAMSTNLPIRETHGRPPLALDERMIYELAGIGCPTTEIARLLECSPDTLDRRFADVMAKGRAERKSSLRRKQTQVALSGNIAMLIWLGKQELGQTERTEITTVNDPLAELIEEFKKVAEKSPKVEGL